MLKLGYPQNTKHSFADIGFTLQLSSPHCGKKVHHEKLHHAIAVQPKRYVIAPSSVGERKPRSLPFFKSSNLLPLVLAS